MDVKPSIKAEIIAANDPITSRQSDNLEQNMEGEYPSVPSPVMSKWQPEYILSDIDIPDDLKKAIESSLEKIWTTANKLASVEITKLEQQVLVLSDELKEAREKNRAMQAGLIDISRTLNSRK